MMRMTCNLLYVFQNINTQSTVTATINLARVKATNVDTYTKVVKKLEFVNHRNTWRGQCVYTLSR